MHILMHWPHDPKSFRTISSFMPWAIELITIFWMTVDNQFLSNDGGSWISCRPNSCIGFIALLRVFLRLQVKSSLFKRSMKQLLHQKSHPRRARFSWKASGQIWISKVRVSAPVTSRRHLLSASLSKQWIATAEYLCSLSDLLYSISASQQA